MNLFNLEIEYNVNLLKLFDNNDQAASKPSPETFSKQHPLSDSISTVCDSEYSIPIQLVDCVVGLAPLHLPSHACVLISTGNAHVKISQISGEIAATFDITRGSLLMIDDKKYISSMGGVAATERRHQTNSPTKHGLAMQYLGQGYVSIAIITCLSTEINIAPERPTQKMTISIGLTVNSVYMKSSADSTHSLIQLVNDLKLPVETTPPELKYRTSVSAPINLMDTVEKHAFSPENTQKIPMDDSNADFVEDDVPTNMEFIESYYADHNARSQWTSSSSGSLNTSYSVTDLLLEEDLSSMVARDHMDKSEHRVKSHDAILNISENHFGESSSGPARKSQSVTAKYTSHGHSRRARHANSLPVPLEHDDSTDSGSDIDSIQESSFAHIDGHSNENSSDASASSMAPISIDFKVGEFIWDMHDGYDWRYTRDMITKAVFRVEYEAQEIRKFQEEEDQLLRKKHKHDIDVARASPTTAIHSDDEDEDIESEPASEEGEDVVADVLFNSIYITMSTHQDANDLRKMINKDINDEASDTMSGTSMSNNTATYSTTGRPSSQVSSPYNPSPSLARELRHAGSGRSKLKLKRSKYHKVRIQVSGINGVMSLFSGVNDVLEPTRSNQHLLNRIDVRVRDVEIFDNVATSTWNKFMTYMRSAGEREEGASMFHLIIENVKPVPDIATSELVLNVFVLPLRLHVDQDTLDFITRFFEFQDDRFDSLVAGLQDEIPFIQKADIRAVKVKLDYKPKKIDYAGLRSGHTTEFMNFFILEEAEMTLNHVELYGISGFPRLNTMLNGIWMPDIRSNQLGGVLAGLAPVRSIVRLGSGIKDLIVVPVREYRKDGRVMRSLQKGAWQFARNTTSELVKFGAKLAAGTQTILENAEQAMGGAGSDGRRGAKYKGPSAYADEFSDDEDMPDGSRDLRRIDSNSGDDDDGDSENASNGTLQAKRNVHFPDDESVRSRRSQRAGSSESSNPKNNNNSSAKSRQPNGPHGTAVSLYANQPVGVMEGIYSAYGSMGHNLSIAKHAVTDIRAEAAEKGSAQGAAMAVMRAAPIALIRPMIGATEAVSRTLLGVTNQMDPDQIVYMEEKYRVEDQAKQEKQTLKQTTSTQSRSSAAGHSGSGRGLSLPTKGKRSTG